MQLHIWKGYWSIQHLHAWMQILLRQQQHKASQKEPKVAQYGFALADWGC